MSFWVRRGPSALLQGVLRPTAVSCSSPRLEGQIVRYERNEAGVLHQDVTADRG